MITMSSRLLAGAAAFALLTSCSTAETSAEADAASTELALPSCEQVAAALADRVQGYTLNPATLKTEPDDARCGFSDGSGPIDDIIVAFFLTKNGPENFVGWEALPDDQRLPGLELVEDPLLDGREGYLVRLGEGAFQLTQWRSPSYWLNVTLHGNETAEAVTVGEVVSLLDLFRG